MSEQPVHEGPLELSEHPVGPFDAATKWYVDTAVGEGGFDGGGEVPDEDPEDPSANAPQNVALVGALRTATVVWDSMNLGGLGGYTIQLDSTNSFDSGNLQEANTRGTVQSFGDLLPGNVYYARVKATDASGKTSGWSTIATATLAQVSDDDIVADTITGDRIAVGTLHGDRIEVGTLNADDIQTGTLSAVDIDGVNITGVNISASSFEAGDTSSGASGISVSSGGFVQMNEPSIFEKMFIGNQELEGASYSATGDYLWIKVTSVYDDGQLYISAGGGVYTDDGKVATEPWANGRFAFDPHDNSSHSDNFWHSGSAVGRAYVDHLSTVMYEAQDKSLGNTTDRWAPASHVHASGDFEPASSTRAVKTNIQPADLDALALVRDIQPVTFRFVESVEHHVPADPEDARRLGIIVEDAPWPIVDAKKPTATYGNGYQTLLAMAVQQLDDRVTALETSQ